LLGSCDVIAFTAAADLSRARTFYEQTLGLPLVSQDDFACVFNANGTVLRVTAVSHVSRAGYTVLGWRVRDIEEAVRGLAARGVVFRGNTAWTRTSTVSGRPRAAAGSRGSPIPTATPFRSPSSRSRLALSAVPPVGKRARHMIAIGFTGEPVPPGSRSGAMTHRNDHRPAASHSGARSSNCR
jgi:catechol 2,3-dioxygenase-like lactoylglutathione lyase family enzyme